MGECGTSKQLVKYVSDTEEDESIVIEREQSEEVKSKKWEIFKSKLINSAEKKSIIDPTKQKPITVDLRQNKRLNIHENVTVRRIFNSVHSLK